MESVRVNTNVRTTKWTAGMTMTQKVAQKDARSGPVMHRLLKTTLLVSLVRRHSLSTLGVFVSGIGCSQNGVWSKKPVSPSVRPSEQQNARQRVHKQACTSKTS